MRNPAWNASTDPVRKAYVDKINVSQTGNQQGIQQQIADQHRQPRTWGGTPPCPTAAIPHCSPPRTRSSSSGPTYGTNPYIVFNEVSPNNGAALANLQVRQALEYGINRTDLIQDDGGPIVSPPLTHILPPGIVGSQQIDPYPFNPARRPSSCWPPPSRPQLTLKLLYVSNFDYQVKMFQTLQADLGKVGITVQGVGVPNADFFTKYMEVPGVAHRGVWDMALHQLVSGLVRQRGPVVLQSALLRHRRPTRRTAATSASTTAPRPTTDPAGHPRDHRRRRRPRSGPRPTPRSWPTRPSSRSPRRPSPTYHGSQVHNTVFVPNLNQIDPTNVWLTPSHNGGG